MSYEQQIRQAANPQEALLVLARGFDEVLAALGTTKPGDGWGEWGGAQVAAGNGGGAAVTPEPNDFYAAKTAPMDLEGIDRAERAIERYQGLVDRSPTPTNLALLEQAQRALVKASEPGEYLDHSGDIYGDNGMLAVEEADGGDLVDLTKFRGDPARWSMRRQLAEAIDLPGFFGPLYREGEQREDIMSAYEKGGPMWLYQNRIVDDEHDIFPQLPTAALTVMVVDIQQDSTRAAWEFQRDVMKGDDIEGATLAIAQDNINSVGARGGVPLRGE